MDTDQSGAQATTKRPSTEWQVYTLGTRELTLVHKGEAIGAGDECTDPR